MIKKLSIVLISLFFIVLISISGFGVVQQDNLVANYNFNQLSGDLLDSIKSNHLRNMTKAEGYGFNSPELYSYGFNLTNGTPFETINNMFVGNLGFTISVNYKVNDNNNFNGWTCIVCKQNGSDLSGFGVNWGIYFNPKFNNTLFRVVNTNGNGFYIYSDITTPNQQSNRSKYYNIIATFDNSQGKIYRDSNLRDLGIIPTFSVQESNTPLRVGGRSTNLTGFGGRIDSLYIWNVSLDQDEINEFLNITQEEETSELAEATCPTDLTDLGLLWLIILIAIILIGLGLNSQVGLFGIFGATLLLIGSFYIIPCYALFGAIMILFSAVMIVFFALNW